MIAPQAFYPLSGYSASSWPLPDSAMYNSTANTTTWVPDSIFGSAVQCSVSLHMSSAASKI